MVTNVTSLLKTVKSVEDEHTRGTRALEATVEAIAQEIRVSVVCGVLVRVLALQSWVNSAIVERGWLTLTVVSVITTLRLANLHEKHSVAYNIWAWFCDESILKFKKK